MKEFNRLNDYNSHLNIYNSLTGDVFQINKGFIYGMITDDESE